MTLNRFISLLLLLVTASLVWWLEDVVQTSQEESLRKENNRPDFYMQNFTMNQYTTDGKLHYRAKGESLLRYPKNENMDIKQLDMLSFKEGEAPTSVKSDTASLTNNGDHIFLTGNVIIKQDKTEENDLLLIKTEKLFIDTTRNYMETNTPISIQTSKHKVTGTGMQAWKDYKKIRLLTKVKGRHEP